ncbi:MAG: alkaline phosphatase family protein [Dysgonomonas sp.]
MIRILTSLVAVLTVVSVNSQTTLKETPKLVVGITIDQLRGDYLELFQPNFTEGGFKRLLNGGLVYKNIKFDFPDINAAAAIATIYTGANPFYHGITDYSAYSIDKGKILPIFGDDSYLGNYTQEKMSPKALKVSTITDELRIASLGFSEIYSFAPNAAEALITSSNAGNTAYWLDDYTGKWATSTYYKNFHWTVDQENRNSVYSTSLGSLSWKPLLSAQRYNAFPYTATNTAFQHLFDSYSLVKKTPLTNDYVCSTGLQFVSKADLGKRSYPDFLSFAFYLGNYPKAVNKNYSIEIQDAYVRLDRNIEQLLNDLDKSVGLNNVLIFVSSTGYYDADDLYPADINMPDGVFYTNRCEALLNMYLMAIYGKEQWVDKIYNNQVFLNRKLIQNKNLDIVDFQNKVADFIVQFTGVQDVATSMQLLTAKANDNMIRYKNIYNKDVSGDVFFEIQPGYRIVNEQDAAKQEKRVRETAVAAPVVFFGYSIKPQKIYRTIDATEIAPTVSHILRIRAPNASKSQVLPEFL